ncbi:hypothetical protein FZEAL_3719 [Fusarium zealandicum]|uniref:Ribonuclease H1 N-terminal domain-containing protein n=1 Tax=Fusarium zealandicum TaxID=1053134 RepID=A0A8H4XMA1_9HYPO|nr:hypothetical protein FZEAL_3719 [Fusarium zealandicum]
MPAKFYGVQIGRTPGVYTEWNRAFNTYEEARRFVNAGLPWGRLPVRFDSAQEAGAEGTVEHEGEATAGPSSETTTGPSSETTAGPSSEAVSEHEHLPPPPKRARQGLKRPADAFSSDDKIPSTPSSSSAAEASGFIYRDLNKAIEDMVLMFSEHKAIRIIPVD